nr:transposase [Streptomyces sp. NWU339]
MAGEADAYPRLAPALTRPIRWELIAQQYDQMTKYATAIRTRTASAEAILRRFTRNASHPTYVAMLEVGRAQKTIFVARYLRLRDLQREIEEGLNVMESSNGANSVIAYGKGGEITSSRRRAGDVRPVPADPPVRPGLREHPDAPGHPRRTGVGRPPHARRPARPDSTILVPREPLSGRFVWL